MAQLSSKARNAITARRNLVDECLRVCGGPVILTRVCELTGLSKYHVQAALRALCDGGAATICGSSRVQSAGGGFNKIALYQTTGKPYDYDKAAKLHASKQKTDHYKEPEGGIQEHRLGPNHRLIRFGKKSPKGDGQRGDVPPYTGGSSLNAVPSISL